MPARLHAAYNFVPLSAFVHKLPWADQISHDVPFQDGLSGWLDLDIETAEPTLVGGEQIIGQDGRRHVHPLKIGGKHAIAPSALRGMLRSVLEIAAFGQMRFVDRRQFGMRDLGTSQAARRIYRNRLVNNVEAGWLSLRTDGSMQVLPCQFAHVTFLELEKISVFLKKPLPASAWHNNDPPDVRNSMWHPRPRDVELTIAPKSGSQSSVKFDASLARPGQARVRGSLVFTGKTTRGVAPPAKRHEFFFFPDAHAVALDLAPQVFTGFQSIHDPPENPTARHPGWAMWEPRFRAGEPIPVFFIRDPQGGVASLGLAQMFKLAHSLGVGEMIANTRTRGAQKSPHQVPTIDFAVGLFGHASDDDKDGLPGLRGRVSFEPAIRGGNDTGTVTIGPVILLNPKGAYFPIYVRQPVNPRNLRQLAEPRVHASYTPLSETGDAREVKLPEIAGWKRYPAHRHRMPPIPRDLQGSVQVQSILHAVPRGKHFKGRVHFHNVRPVELGAVLWCLEWGGRGDLCHSLGTGRPLGMGLLKVRVQEVTADSVQPNEFGANLPSKKTLIDAFARHMTRTFADVSANRGTWAASEQIVTLLAMADPANGNRLAEGDRLENMIGTTGKDTPALFKAARDDGLVLAPYPDLIGAEGWNRESEVFQRPEPPKSAPPAARPRTQARRPGPTPWLAGDRIMFKGELIEFLEDIRVAKRTGQARYVDDDDGEIVDIPVAELLK